jgi:hypothetical protein
LENSVRLVVVCAIVLLVLAGCGTPAPVVEPDPPKVQAPEPEPAPPPPPPPPPPPVVTASARALASGVALYDAGDFNGAIKRLAGAREIWDDSASADALANKVAANKYIAFSYCVTNRRTQCRKHFVDALKLDPGFALEATEKTHPVWGAEFERAKKQASASIAPAKRPAPAPQAAPKGTKSQ